MKDPLMTRETTRPSFDDSDGGLMSHDTSATDRFLRGGRQSGGVGSNGDSTKKRRPRQQQPPPNNTGNTSHPNKRSSSDASHHTSSTKSNTFSQSSGGSGGSNTAGNVRRAQQQSQQPAQTRPTGMSMAWEIPVALVTARPRGMPTSTATTAVCGTIATKITG